MLCVKRRVLSFPLPLTRMKQVGGRHRGTFGSKFGIPLRFFGDDCCSFRNFALRELLQPKRSLQGIKFFRQELFWVAVNTFWNFSTGVKMENKMDHYARCRFMHFEKSSLIKILKIRILSRLKLVEFFRQELSLIAINTFWNFSTGVKMENKMDHYTRCRFMHFWLKFLNWNFENPNFGLS